jgi:biopolymer transport protein ExbB
MIIQSLPLAFLLGDATFLELFHMGGPIMWPILLVSFVMITVVVERILFIIRENATREPEVVEKMLENVEKGDVDGAVALGKQSKDFIARILVYSLTNKEYSMANAFVRASSMELQRFQQGSATLDTIVTVAPMLGLLGTVTGMMRTFGSMTGDIASATGQITGGVAEALIATACGLAIAIIALLPFNILNARTEEAKHEVADAANALEIIIKKSESNSVSS